MAEAITLMSAESVTVWVFLRDTVVVLWKYMTNAVPVEELVSLPVLVTVKAHYLIASAFVEDPTVSMSAEFAVAQVLPMVLATVIITILIVLELVAVIWYTMNAVSAAVLVSLMVLVTAKAIVKIVTVSAVALLLLMLAESVLVAEFLKENVIVMDKNSIALTVAVVVLMLMNAVSVTDQV